MQSRTWHGIGVGTLIVAVGLWFSMLAVTTSVVTGLGIAAVTIVMAAYAMAAFSGAVDKAGTGFKAALSGLMAGVGMFGLFLATSSDVFVVAAPVVAVGAAGTYGLTPTEPLVRRAFRLGSLVIGSTVVWLVFTVDPLVYGLIVPLIPLPAVGFADRVFNRMMDVMDEDPIGGTGDAAT